MPDTTRGADRTKVLSVRFTAEEFDALSARATEVGVGPSTLARTYVRQALATSSPAGPMGATSDTEATGSTREDSALEAHLRERLEALLAADLVTRVEALEKRPHGD